MVRGVVRFLLTIFYRRIEVVGIERIPENCPLILAANHHGALVAPMILLATMPRRLHPLAKAPLFRHPLIGPFLRLTGAIPVHRRQDEGSDPALNREMFRSVARLLASRGAILIFPEGVSQAEPALMPLRTGAARILLSAEAEAGGQLGVMLLPVGLVFHEPGSFRTGWALALVGEPVLTDDCAFLYRTDPAGAVRRLTERLTGALRALIVEADDRENLRLFKVAEAIWREESDDAARDPSARTAWLKRATETYQYLRSRDPARVLDLGRRLERYQEDLELAGLKGRQLSQSYAPGVVWRYAIREGCSLLLGLPLAFWGIVNHLIPYQLTAIAVRFLRPAPDEEATYKISLAILVYPLSWIIEGWSAWRLGGKSGLALFVISLLPTGFFALTWRERLGRFLREARGFLRFLLERDLHRRLLTERRSLMEKLGTLSRLAPDAAPTGEKEERR